MTVVAVDYLVAVRVHAAVDRRPGEVGIADVWVVGVARIEDRRERPVPNLEETVDDLDGDTVRGSVVADERAIVRVGDRPVSLTAVVGDDPPRVAVELPVDD